MKIIALTFLVVLSTASLTACDGNITGKACLGPDSDSVVESLQDQCKAGDAIATKNPASFCDFDHAIAYNDYNSAFCIYAGAKKPERTIQE